MRGVAHGWDRDRRRFPGTGSGSQDRPSGKRVRRTNRSRLLDGPRRPFGDHGLRRLVLHPLGVPLADDPNIYSVYWVQIAVEPQRGWCLANAHGFMREPGSSVGAWIPKPPATAGLNSIGLSVTSHGRLLGKVKQRFRLSHGVTSATVERRSGGDRYSWHWQGRSRDKVLIEVGAEFARAPSGGEIYVTKGGSDLKSVQC